MNISTRKSIATSALLATMATSASALSATVWVEKWGEDSEACGKRSAPCLTIQYAIDQRSASGTRIVVGPGVYQEPIEIGQNADGEPLTKLRLESSNGYRASMIQHNFANTPGISIHANEVRIGRKNRGFTVRTPNNSMGIQATGAVLYDGITIEGNRVTQSSYGIFIHGENTNIRHNIAERSSSTGIFCAGCFNSVIKNNVSRDNGWGFAIESHDDLVFSRNVASYNENEGFYIIAGGAIEFLDNAAEFNQGAGFELHSTPGTTKMHRNIALANHSHGFDLGPGLGVGNRVLTQNAAIGNIAAGLHIDHVTDLNIKGNTFNGNLIGVNLLPGSSTNNFSNNNTIASAGGCGVQNQSGSDLAHTKHYFGDPFGPDDIFDADNHDGVCGPDAVEGSHAAKPHKFRANTAARL